MLYYKYKKEHMAKTLKEFTVSKDTSSESSSHDFIK